jgi:hypothetical protein
VPPGKNARPAREQKGPSLEQINEEIAALKALVMDLVIESKKMQSALVRLREEIWEIKKRSKDISGPPSPPRYVRTTNGVTIHGISLRLRPDVTEVFCFLVNQDRPISKQELAALCKNQSNRQSDGLRDKAIYERIKRLKKSLNNHRTTLADCIVNIPQGKEHLYQFDAEKFRRILGIE